MHFLQVMPPLPPELTELSPDQVTALAGVIIVVVIIATLIGLAIGIVVCYLLYTCFDRIPAQHRLMEPWQVFLCLIPCFNLVWNFFVYPKLSQSFQSYFSSVGRTDVGDCGQQLGLWFAITCAVSVVPLVNYLAAPASLVLLILYLVKVLGLKNQISQVV